MNRISDQGTNSEHCLERIGSGTQMCNGTQIFKAVTLLLQRVIRSACTFHYNLVCLHLKGLFCTGRLYNRTCYNDSCSDADFGNICIIIQLVRCVYNLQRLKKGTVIYNQESKIFGIPVASYPAAYCHLLTGKLFFFSE